MDTRHRHARAARRLLDELDDDQRAAARFPLHVEERGRWTYLPGERHGTAMSSLGRPAAVAALRLLATGLSDAAFAQAAAVMALEDVLDSVSEGSRERHRGDYWLAVYGEPGDGDWGWRIEGHHLSVNATCAEDGPIRLTPLFLGANPARTERHGRTVLEPLGPEEHIGFELVASLDRDALGRAVISDRAPDDIVTGDRSRVDGQPQPTGVAVDRLEGHPRHLADELIDLYLDRLPAGALRPPGDDIRFAWAGGQQPGQPHYYRLQGSRLLVELDNTQNGANHVHTVVRDLAGDFGADVLGLHLRESHGAGQA